MRRVNGPSSGLLDEAGAPIERVKKSFIKVAPIIGHELISLEPRHFLEDVLKRVTLPSIPVEARRYSFLVDHARYLTGPS